MLPRMREVIDVLNRTLATQSYLSGERFSLADMFLFPLIWVMRLKPESAAMLQASAHLMTWYDRIAARPSAHAVNLPTDARLWE